MLLRLLQRYTGFWRSLKPMYMVYNWLHADRLRHNRNLYRQAGLHKSIFSSLGSRDFSGKAQLNELPWLDRPDALTQLVQHPTFATLPPEWQVKCRQFVQDGYLILERFLPDEDVAALNETVDQLLRSGKVGYNFTGRKIFNLHTLSTLADQRFFRQPDLLNLLSFLLGREVVPFQSLNFIRGSEQRAHSDSIHMTTHPMGYLIATWMALEDCTSDSGLLAYYPGSHRLPYVTTQDYDAGNTAWTIGTHSNERYEDAIAQLIARHNLQPQVFAAKRGDVLIWHANLLHAGTPITNQQATRRSMVCHYFAKDVICYHELSQRPALL